MGRTRVGWVAGWLVALAVSLAGMAHGHGGTPPTAGVAGGVLALASAGPCVVPCLSAGLCGVLPLPWASVRSPAASLIVVLDANGNGVVDLAAHEDDPATAEDEAHGADVPLAVAAAPAVFVPPLCPR